MFPGINPGITGISLGLPQAARVAQARPPPPAFQTLTCAQPRLVGATANPSHPSCPCCVAVHEVGRGEAAAGAKDRQGLLGGLLQGKAGGVGLQAGAADLHATADRLRVGIQVSHGFCWPAGPGNGM